MKSYQIVMGSAVSRIHAWWCVCADHNNDVVCTLKREQTIKIRKWHYIKELIKSTLQTIIQWAYFQHFKLGRCQKLKLRCDCEILGVLKFTVIYWNAVRITAAKCLVEARVQSDRYVLQYRSTDYIRLWQLLSNAARGPLLVFQDLIWRDEWTKYK